MTRFGDGDFLSPKLDWVLEVIEESQWDPLRKNLVRRLLEEQDKVLRSYFAQKGGARSQRGEGVRARVGNTSSGTCMREQGAKSVCGPKLTDQIVFKGRVRKLG